MRLCRFEIRNFKNLEAVHFEWEDIIVLIGENNCGKSSVIQALNLFLSGKQLKDRSLFHNEVVTEDNAVELIGYFDNLTESEREQIAIRGRIHEDNWILRKKFWSSVPDVGNEDWEELYFSFHQDETFSEWPEDARSWDAWPESYRELIQELRSSGNSRPNNETRQRLKQMVRERKPELIELTEPNWIPNPGGGGNWKSNANSLLPRLIHVPAVLEASTETQAKESTTYGKILSLIVERRLVHKPEVRELQSAIARVQALFRFNPDFPELLRAQEIIDVEDQISELLEEVISARARIFTHEINLPEFLLPNTTLKLDDGFTTTVDKKGHGLQRTLIMALLQVLSRYAEEDSTEGDIIAKPIILAVDEPELYMHPQMERKMRDALYRLARLSNYQVICSTHSPVFLDMAENHKSIVRLKKTFVEKYILFRSIQRYLLAMTRKNKRNDYV